MARRDDVKKVDIRLPSDVWLLVEPLVRRRELSSAIRLRLQEALAIPSTLVDLSGEGSVPDSLSHRVPVEFLIADIDALDDYLRQLPAAGRPSRGAVLVALVRRLAGQ